MSNAKEIRSKIASVENTQKITSAMEMVATSKMRNAQQAMAASLPYAEALRNVISHIAKSTSLNNNPYIHPRSVKKACFIVVSTDRGLCGGLNTNLFKRVLQTYTDFAEQGIQVEFAVIGNKANAFFSRLGTIAYSLTNLGDRPSSEKSLGFVQGIVNDFLEGKYDQVELFHNKFVNTLTQEPKREQYLPLPQLPESVDKLDRNSWDYIYEGDAKEILIGLVNRYVELQVHSSILETVACELAARMTAMKAATDNASALIDELNLIYNKARQASITNELNEIVAGAAAV